VYECGDFFVKTAGKRNEMERRRSDNGTGQYLCEREKDEIISQAAFDTINFLPNSKASVQGRDATRASSGYYSRKK
jgi:hypothetical protein